MWLYGEHVEVQVTIMLSGTVQIILELGTQFRSEGLSGLVTPNGGVTFSTSWTVASDVWFVSECCLAEACLCTRSAKNQVRNKAAYRISAYELAGCGVGGLYASVAA
jgi:hypothetical protein